MIDIHTHTLFGMDDGAQTIEDSLNMIKMQREQGVNTIVVTPHFNCIKQDLDSFIKQRDLNLSLLRQAVSQTEWSEITLLSGSEILYSTDLDQIDLSNLVIEGTDYLLIEFSTNSLIMNLENKMQSIINRGYLPIIAHMERYPFLQDKPSLIKDLVELGCLMQVNGSTFINENNKGFIKACMKRNLIHCVASDSHSVGKRRPNMKDTLESIKKSFGGKTSRYLLSNSTQIISNQLVKVEELSVPKKVFGKWI